MDENKDDFVIEVIYDPILKAQQIIFKKPQENKNINRKRKAEKDNGFSNSKCKRCGRYGHFLLQCYAKRHRNGDYLG
jgi:hypothetical protein